MRQAGPFRVVEQSGSIWERLIVSASDNERNGAASQDSAYLSPQAGMALL